MLCVCVYDLTILMWESLSTCSSRLLKIDYPLHNRILEIILQIVHTQKKIDINLWIIIFMNPKRFKSFRNNEARPCHDRRVNIRVMLTFYVTKLNPSLRCCSVDGLTHFSKISLRFRRYGRQMRRTRDPRHAIFNGCRFFFLYLLKKNHWFSFRISFFLCYQSKPTVDAYIIFN